MRDLDHPRGNELDAEDEVVLGSLHQEIHAVGVGHRNEPRLGIDFEMVVDVAQALGRLLQAAVEMVDGFFLSPGCGRRKGQREDGARLGVTGWVRNRRDGTVEAVVDGATDAVDAILAWARRGPRGATVTEVEVSEIPENFERFELRPTG